jgi:6-phosphogluconolactonase
VNTRVHAERRSAVEALCEHVVALQPRTLVLTGGSTAGDAYRLLASPPWRPRLPWDEMTLLFGDERRVPPTSDDSNYRLAEQTLLAGVTPAAVERVRGEAADPDAEADRYGALIPERLDLTLLGMGDDGHCASLFPGEPSLDVTDRLCVPSRAHYAPFERFTLTYPALNRSRHVAFLVLGSSKAEAVAAIARGEDRPAARLAPVGADVTWFLDRDSAAGLPSS